MNSLPHHIYFKDLDSRFIRINEAHAQSFRLDSPDDAIGKSDLDFFSEEHAKQAFEDEQIIIRTGKSLITEEKETWEDRPDSWASTIKLPLVNRHGETIGTFGISSDITQRKQAEKEIASKNRQLEQMNSDKDKLFSIIAHDLRSPFNALLGLTGLMSDESESLTAEEMVKMAAMVRKSAVQINEELGNLLEWSRIQMNAVPVAPVLQNLGKVIDSELLLLGQASQRKSLRMINSIPPAIQVTADEQMLHSILRNLLANAIKFTRKGGLITICAKVTDEHFAEISVADTGIGMNPETLGRLFFMNENGCRKGTDGEPGSGLGLIICKELVEKMGGQVRAESEEGMGSTFSFSIPS
jgi:PAS domain S-box-containing protein